MKKIICLVIAACLVLSASSVLAEGKEIDGGKVRNIQIQPAGENPVEEGVSPTTGRKLADVAAEAPEGAAGLAVTGRYMPVIAQIINVRKGVDNYAPLYGTCADIVYQSALNAQGLDRMSMVFSDVIPPYAGFVRSTRPMHILLRQEWDCAYVTSGWSDADVPDVLKSLGIRNPMTTDKLSAEEPGFIYPSDAENNKSHPWKEYERRMTGRIVPGAPNNVVAELAALVNNLVPQDYVPRNHAFRFTDEKPEGGDEASFIYVTMTASDSTSDDNDTYSELEYDAETNTYFRYVYKNGTAVVYRENIPQDVEKLKINDENWFSASDLVPGREIEFSNVIVQFTDYDWVDYNRPQTKMVDTGNADYFMGGRHFRGVWQREDDNSRTVFYGEDGNEIELQRGRTLIIILDWEHYGRVSYE